MKYTTFITSAKILAITSIFSLTTACGGGGSDAGSTVNVEPIACVWNDANWDDCNWQ